jgi:hypothetical protein
MAEPMEQLLDLIFGRWRSQILYAGAALGVFDCLTAEGATSAAAVAPEVGADPALLYRLLRSLASIGLLAEDADQSFRLTEAGALLREDHPHSLKAMALLEEGPEHYAIWKHLVAMVRDGRQNGFMREFGRTGFDYARDNRSYGSVFNQAVTSYSIVETQWALAALAIEDLSYIGTLCDVGGGHGQRVPASPRYRTRLAGGGWPSGPVMGAEARTVRPLPLRSRRHVPRNTTGRSLRGEIGAARLERRGMHPNLRQHATGRGRKVAVKKGRN